MLGQSSLLTSMMAAPSGLRPQDVFATSLYTGNGASRTITTNLNMSGEGGMVWTKERSAIIGGNHFLCDTVRGANKQLSSNTVLAEQTRTDSFNSFTGIGYTLGSDVVTGTVNYSGASYVSWSFRKAPKFFDVVTYTGNGTASRAISHNLGVAPGMIIIKALGTGSWIVNHCAFNGGDNYATLESADRFYTSGEQYFGTGVGGTYIPPTSTHFTISGTSAVNGNGGGFIAYLFAHDTGTSGVVQCGSFTTDGSGNATVNLGWSPQFIIRKLSASTGNWQMYDTARGFAASGSNKFLYPNLNAAEATESYIYMEKTATGFKITGVGSSTPYIYLAIREPV